MCQGLRLARTRLPAAQTQRLKLVNRYLVGLFVRTRRTPPAEVILDADATDDPVHGGQHLSAYHGYYRQHQYLPLLVFDGHTAVYVFFLISGAVLMPSFARPGRFLGKFAKRLVRLDIPVAAAAAIATLLLALLPDAHRQASALTGSAWLAMDESGAPTLAHLAREIGLDSLLLGYREATLFAPLAPHLPQMELSLDAPFWSLHLELYGSLLVLCLVTLRTWSPVAHCIAVDPPALGQCRKPVQLAVPEPSRRLQMAQR